MGSSRSLLKGPCKCGKRLIFIALPLLPATVDDQEPDPANGVNVGVEVQVEHHNRPAAGSRFRVVEHGAVDARILKEAAVPCGGYQQPASCATPPLGLSHVGLTLIDVWQLSYLHDSP